MDPIARMVAAGAAGAAGAGEATYVDDVFSTYLYEGNGSTQTINNGIDLSGEGGLVWIKRRDSSANHRLGDTERGTTKYLISNQDIAETTNTNIITSYNNNGFDLSTHTQVNGSGGDYVSWTFRKAPGFFDVVTYTGSGNARTVPHNLGSVPGMIIVKATDDTAGWYVYHRALGSTGLLRLNVDNGSTSTYSQWNQTDPTASVFSLAGQGYNVNENGVNYVAYIFAHDDQSFGTDGDESIVKCGSYTGGGSSETTVDLGFEPQWVIIKRTSASADWALYDNMRGVVTSAPSGDMEFRPNQNSAETDENRIDFYAQGFKLQNDAAPTNGSGSTYIYMAIRRPHKPPTAGTEVFGMAQSVANAEPSAVSSFPVDMAIRTDVTTTQQRAISARLMEGKFLYINKTNSEASSSNFNFDFQNGVSNIALTGYDHYMFRRAPGFFDVVTYTGTSSLSGVNHNLGVTPELKIIKSRSDTSDWVVGGSAVAGENGYIYLHDTAGTVSSTNYWDGGDDGATQFSVRNTNAGSDYSGRTYVAYLFATLDGISKVGSYTGTGSDLNVDCGFAAGARFVLIKRTDSSGDWYVWDTDRGIVSGNDPYFLLNSTAAQVTTTDYIDPLNAGFTVTSSAPAAINASGGTYLFLAIA